MYLRYTLLICILCLAHNSPLLAQNPYKKRLTSADGLPSNVIYQIYRDSDNFLWFATDAGAARYDGKEFQYFSMSESLNSNEVIKVQEDKRGRIWFFHLNGSFDFLEGNLLYNSGSAPFLDSLSNKRIFKRIFSERNGVMYFYNNTGKHVYSLDDNDKVVRYEAARIASDVYEDKTPCEITSPSFIGHKNDKFIVYRHGGIYSLADFNASPVAINESMWIYRSFEVNDSITFIDAKCKRSLRKMVIKLHYDEMLDTIYFPYRNDGEMLSDVYEDREGNYWLSSFFTGVYCIKNNNLLHHFDISQAQSITEDYEGNIWIASMGDGAYKINPSVLLHTHWPVGAFQNRGILGISHRADGGLWAVDGQALFVVDDNSIRGTTFSDSTSRIDQVVEMRNKSLFLGESNAYLRYFSGIHTENGAIAYRQLQTDDKMVKRFSINDAKSEIASSHHGVYVYRAGQNGFFNSDALISKSDNRIYYLYYNWVGELFANSDKIYRVADNQLIEVPDLSIFDGKIIRQHLNLDEHTELFNLAGDSLYLFRDQEIINLFNKLEHPIKHKIKHMEYRAPYLVLASDAHIFFICDPLSTFKGKSLAFENLGVNYDNIHQILLTESDLVVASDNGLSFIPHTNFEKRHPEAPNSYFKAILVNEKAITPGTTISSRRDGKLQFILGSLHFSDLAAEYAYKMDGLDQNWTYRAGSNIVYQNLPAGQYTFRSKVKLATTAWSPELTCEVVIVPNFWEHPLFYIALGIISGAIIYFLLYRNKHEELKRRNIENQMLILEQKALNAMMNPHFIFNALSSIQSFILKNEVSEAGLYLSKFSRLIRQNMNAIRNNMTEIEEETERLANYLELELLRTNNRFRYQIDVDKQIEEDTSIPAMIVQPIVENAVRHGMADLAEGGFIQISFKYVHDNAIRIIVEDNGIGIERSSKRHTQKESHLRIGMSLTKKRIEILGKKTGVGTSMLITDANPEAQNPGTRIEIVVPCSLNDNDAI